LNVISLIAKTLQRNFVISSLVMLLPLTRDLFAKFLVFVDFVSDV